MCDTCGCGDTDGVRVTVPGDPAGETAHDDDHRAHPHEHGETTTSGTVRVEERILAKNDVVAAANRAWLDERGILAVNVMGSPGAGKTTLLEQTVRQLAGRRDTAVVEGDQETLLDAERIQAGGGRVVQVNTGTGCHLDAPMLQDALRRLGPAPGSVVFVENVGNLVCPALFDLGEHARVVLASVTEGEDKPLKYPHMFRSADLVLLTKIDLLPYVPFDSDRFVEFARRLRPDVEVVRISALRDDGVRAWREWLDSMVRPAASSRMS
ncbi:MAG: hydrogenase nickel incorporation protein HypB [Streptosporangiales bacterium]|nr:hydrogenase nickel incorporation protein HypB [Streptosporangiales bacterium]